MSVCAAVALASLLGAPTPAAITPQSKPEDLVRLLADKSYKVREKAATELIRKGSSALAALTAATKDPDPEVAERSKQLLPQVAAVERNEKLVLLLKDPSAPPPKGLAGLETFLKATGDTKEARELYAELMHHHGREVELAEKDPRKGAEEFAMFCNDAYNRYQANARMGRYNMDNMFGGRQDISYLLFAASDTRLRKNDNGMNKMYMFFNGGGQLVKAVSGKDGSPAMKKLFLNWLEHEPQSWIQQQGFQVAANAGMKEALPLVLRLLEKKDSDNQSRVQVMTALTRLGGKEHIPLLDKYLSDATQITSINFGNGDTLVVQVRDVAMGVQVQLAGQKLADFGFDTRFGNAVGMSYHYYGFREDDPKEPNKSKARDEAHAKWKDWTAKNLKKDGKGPDAKKDEPKAPEKDRPAESKPVEKKPVEKK